MIHDPNADLEAPWGEHSLPPEGVLSVEIGPLALRARVRSGEVWLTHDPGDWLHAGQEPSQRDPSPDDEGWTRWPVPSGVERLYLAPAFPPRPLVVKPEHSFRLLPRSSARIFVSVPLWARVVLAGPDGQPLTELPTVTLSDTWWGEFTEGELCYWLSTTARREVRSAPFPPHLAVCPVELTNRSGEELEVERIALRVAHLAVYRGKEGLWSDVTRVRYRGEEQASEVEVSGKPPLEATAARRVSEARVPVSRKFSARTFSRLKYLSGLGGM